VIGGGDAARSDHNGGPVEPVVADHHVAAAGKKQDWLIESISVSYDLDYLLIVCRLYDASRGSAQLQRR
jgi:hypothetical protein